jgi:hypothetical protein
MRLFRPFVRAVLLAACLLAVAPAATVEQSNLFGRPGGEREMPNRFIRVDGFDVGPGVAFGDFGHSLFWARMGTFSYVQGWLRFGTTLADIYTERGIFWGENLVMVLPVTVGFTLWAEPKRTEFFYGVNPDVYVQVSCAPWSSLMGGESAARLALCGDVDYYGIGLRVETGGVAALSRSASAFYAGFQVRLLAFGIGF